MRAEALAPAGRVAPRAAQHRRLLHVFSTFAVGGPQARTAELVRGLGGGLEHVVVAADGRADAVAALGLEGRVRVVPLPLAKGRGVSPGNLVRLRRLLAAERPDLLLTYNFGALEAALANRLWPVCPHLHVEDGFGPEESAGRQLPRRVWLRRVALSGGARLVVPSRTLERIARETWRLAPARVSYVANGIDLDRFAAAAPDPALRERPGQILIGTVGALRPEKNQRRLVRAAAAVPGDVRLVIVGEGAERAALLAEAAACGIAGRLVLAGQRPDPERVLAALDIFALSSDTEQMPISLIEAMAAGRACAATDVGDVRAMLPAAQGPFVVPAADEAALGRALATLAADPALRAALGGLNRARAAAELDRRTMVARWAALLDGAMAAGRRRAARG